jgi:ferric-dicitrate binding protein FerR (iron transport regulator)
MSTSTPAPQRDSDASTALPLRTPLADENALHDTFLAEYPMLAAEAQAELGADAAALIPKVVEGAFVRAWDARARFQTPAQVHQFLIEDVHHAAARALSRRATAHRFAGHEATTKQTAHRTEEINMEQSWAHVLDALRGDAHSPQALADAAARSRHGAAEHIAVIEKSGPAWKLVAILVLVAGALYGAVMAMNYMGADAKIATAVNAADVHVVTSPPGQIGLVTLGDGSTARLAPESKLSIPKNFGPTQRAVKLEGAAVFTVAPGLKENFQVYGRDVIVVAKGTKFAVRAYENDEASTVVVREGLVEVRHGTQAQPLPAGAALLIPRGGAPRAATSTEADEGAGWDSGKLTISNRPLRDVLTQLRRWYGLTVSVPHDTVLGRLVTLRASLDSSGRAIREIERSTGLEFGYVGKNMVFRERTTAPGARSPSKQK